jgi:hypothetical protein
VISHGLSPIPRCPLFTGVRGRLVLRSSPLGGSRKSALHRTGVERRKWPEGCLGDDAGALQKGYDWNKRCEAATVAAPVPTRLGLRPHILLGPCFPTDQAGPSSCPYSPERVEGVHLELRSEGVLGSSEQVAIWVPVRLKCGQPFARITAANEGGGVRRDRRASKPRARRHGAEPGGAASAEDRASARSAGDGAQEEAAAEEQGSARRMRSGISHSFFLPTTSPGQILAVPIRDAGDGAGA